MGFCGSTIVLVRGSFVCDVRARRQVCRAELAIPMHNEAGRVEGDYFRITKARARMSSASVGFAPLPPS